MRHSQWSLRSLAAPKIALKSISTDSRLHSLALMAKLTMEMVTPYSPNFSNGWRKSSLRITKTGGVRTEKIACSGLTSKVKKVLMQAAHIANAWKTSLVNSLPSYCLSSCRLRTSAMSMV